MVGCSEEYADVKDWSSVVSDTGSLGGKVDWIHGCKEFELTSSQIETYNRDGFLGPIRVLKEEYCEKLLKDYQLLIDGGDNKLYYEHHKNQTGDSDNVLFHALGHWRITRRFHDLVYLPTITVPSSQIIVPASNEKTSVRLWHDQLFAKPPRHGGNVAWHQDFSYWTRTAPMQHLTVHVALDEQTIENGCIHYIPRSHTWTREGKPLPVTDFNFKDMESIKTILTEEELREFKPVACQLKPGEAVFHHPLSVHGSYPNRSDQPRRAAVVNYIADGVVSKTDELLLENTNLIKKGEKLEGKFYPVVFDPKWMISSEN